MSAETMQHLNYQTLIGFTEKRGTAWHYRIELQGDEPNHYPGAIPVDDLQRRLWNWDAVEGEITATATIVDEDGVRTITDDAPDWKPIMRSDTGKVLGMPKHGYEIHQYQDWLVENVSRILDADLKVGSAGLLKGGAQAWVQIEMEDTMTAAEGVEFRPFLTAATSLDGSIATTYLTGAQVVVCDNTLSVALGSFGERIKVRHSRNSLSRITDVREALNIVHSAADTFMQQVDELTSTVVTDDQWNEFVKAYIGNGQTERSRNLASIKAGELNRLWNYDPRVAPWQGSAYGVLAAVNTHVHHIQTVRNVDRAERNMSNVVTGKFDKLDRGTLALLAMVQ